MSVIADCDQFNSSQQTDPPQSGDKLNSVLNSTSSTLGGVNFKGQTRSSQQSYVVPDGYMITWPVASYILLGEEVNKLLKSVHLK